MGAPLTGQVSVTGTAQQVDPGLTANSCVGFTIKAPLSNGHSVFIGPSGVTTSTGHVLSAGDSMTYERFQQNGQPAYQLRPSDFWVVGTSGDTVTWLASP